MTLNTVKAWELYQAKSCFTVKVRELYQAKSCFIDCVAVVYPANCDAYMQLLIVWDISSFICNQRKVIGFLDVLQ